MVSGRPPFRIIFGQIFRRGTDKEIIVFQFSEPRRGEWLLEHGWVHGTLGMAKRNRGLILHVMNGAKGWITWFQVRGHQTTRNSPLPT